MRSNDNDNNHRRNDGTSRPLFAAELDELTESTRVANTAFGLDAYGAIEWRLSGPERALLYRLAAETGLTASEIASLTAESFDLDSDLATVTIGAANCRRRREESRPLRQSTAAALREFLIEHAPDDLAFNLPSRHDLDCTFRLDVDAARVVLMDRGSSGIGFSILRTTYLAALVARGVAGR